MCSCAHMVTKYFLLFQCRPFKNSSQSNFFDSIHQYMKSYIDWQHTVDVIRFIMENTFAIYNYLTDMTEVAK
jgi:hypothetical protein